MSTDSNQFFSAFLRASSSRWDTHQVNITQLYNSLNLAMMPAFKLLFTTVPSEQKNVMFFKRVSVFLSLKTLLHHPVASYNPSAS